MTQALMIFKQANHDVNLKNKKPKKFVDPYYLYVWNLN